MASQEAAMAPKTLPSGFNLHPIHLEFVNLSKLVFVANENPMSLAAEDIQKAISVPIAVKISANVGDGRATVVSLLSLAVGTEEAHPEIPEKQPVEPVVAHEPARPYYALEVATTAGFHFDPKEMSEADVREWCHKGSFFVLMPYLRDLVARITRESGFPVVLLPLLEVPTFRPPQKSPADTNKAAGTEV